MEVIETKHEEYIHYTAGFPQRLEKLKMVMEKSRNVKDWQRVMDFLISCGVLPILPPDLTKLVYLLTLRNLTSI